MCPPGLHITLGIFLRLFVLLEEDCHKLDLAKHIEGNGRGPSYEKYAAILQQQTQLKDEQHSLRGDLKVLEQRLTHTLTSAGQLSGVLATTNPVLLDTVREIQETKSRVQSIVSTRTRCCHWLKVPSHAFLSANRHRQPGKDAQRWIP